MSLLSFNRFLFICLNILFFRSFFRLDGKCLFLNFSFSVLYFFFFWNYVYNRNAYTHALPSMLGGGGFFRRFLVTFPSVLFQIIIQLSRRLSARFIIYQGNHPHRTERITIIWWGTIARTKGQTEITFVNFYFFECEKHIEWKSNICVCVCHVVCAYWVNQPVNGMC